jgi:CRISPR-associated protein Cas1
LYVTNPDSYLALDGENVVIRRDDAEVFRIPLHNLEGIVTFGYTGASPALMSACAKKDISLCFMSARGHFLARVTGEVRGNVLLRKKQYSVSEDEKQSVDIARNMIAAKIYNARWIIERATRDHPMRIDVDRFKEVSERLYQSLRQLQDCGARTLLMGIEGNSAKAYFSIFDHLILQQKEDFVFSGRNKRPPLDKINAMLSFAYTLLANEVAAALETVGLDPYVGFLHSDRPGRPSLALDMMEELRPVYADRLVISLINKREIDAAGFVRQESGAVFMENDARKKILSAWQARKQEVITHPFLQEKISWGLVPYAQSMLLARYLRGDLDAYPSFFWK